MYLVYVLCVKDQGRTKDEPRNTERTPRLKKVLFLRLCPFNGLVLAAIPASSHPITLVHLVLPFPFLLAVLLYGVPDNACGVFGCALRFRPRVNPRLSLSIIPNMFGFSFLPAAGYALAVPSASPSSPLNSKL